MNEYEYLLDGLEKLADEAKEISAQHYFEQEKRYAGMHNGTVAGKWFERSRRNRKSHAQRRAEIVARSSSK